jgi:hypothetical protein
MVSCSLDNRDSGAIPRSLAIKASPIKYDMSKDPRIIYTFTVPSDQDYQTDSLSVESLFLFVTLRVDPRVLATFAVL